MKIRGPSELNNALNKALAWRKKEISNLHLLIQDCPREHQKKVLRRSGIMIYYAHWEGFTKQAANFYLEMVSRQKLLYKDLKTCFVAIACRSKIRDAAASKQTDIHTKLIEFITFSQDETAKIPFDDIIDTESNLNTKVLQNLLFTIGLDLNDYWKTKFCLIDGSLLKTRNEIAHGENVEVDEATYTQCHDLVVDFLYYLKDVIENAAVTESYKRPTIIKYNKNKIENRS